MLILECIWGKKSFQDFTLRVGGWGQLSWVNDKQRHTQQDSPKINSLWPWLFYAMSVFLTETCLWWCQGLLEGSVSSSSGLVGQDPKWTCKGYPICLQSLRLQTDPDCWLSSVRKILRAHRAQETYIFIYKLWAWIILLASVSRCGLESLWCSSFKRWGCKFCISLLI